MAPKNRSVARDDNPVSLCRVVEGWKRWDRDTPKLTIEYDHTPNKPTELKTNPTTVCAGTTIGDTGIQLYASVSDPDGGVVNENFKIWKDTATTPTESGSVTNVPSGSASSPFTVTEAWLKSASGSAAMTFDWNVTITQNSLTSDPSDTCKFTYDPSRSSQEPAIAPVTGAQIGTPTDVQISYTRKTLSDGTPDPADPFPTSYQYQLNGGAYSTVPAKTDGTATVSVTPLRTTNALTVTAVSAGGNIDIATGYLAFTAGEADPRVTGDLTGDGNPDLVTVGGTGTGLPSGLWLSPGTTTGTNGFDTAATDIGADGNGIGADGLPDDVPADFDNTQALTGNFTGSNLQDILYYSPSAGTNHATGDDTDYVVGGVLAGTGDGSVIDPGDQNAQYTILNRALCEFDIETFDCGAIPKQLVNAGKSEHSRDPVFGSIDDLLGIIEGDNGYHLAYYGAAGGPGGYPGPYDVTNPTPDGSMDWDQWTLASDVLPDGTIDLFLWNPPTGVLVMWKNLQFTTDDAGDNTLTYDSATTLDNGATATTQFEKNATVTIQATDINHDGTPDLWAIGSGGVATAWLGNGTTVVNTFSQTVLTATHAWNLDQGTDADSPVSTATDIAGTLTLNASPTGANWNTGDLYSPDVKLNGSTGMLDATGPAVTTNADFTVSAWVNATGTNGVVLSQDATNTSGLKVWADVSDNSWRFAMSRTDQNVTTWDTAAAAAGSVHYGVWTLITATYRQSGGLMDLYIDGSLVAHATHPTAYNATGPFRIGAEKNGTDTTGAPTVNAFFTGQVAMVRTDNRPTEGNAIIFGVLPDNQLTYTALDSNNADHVKDLTSTATLPFKPVTMAVLNPSTLLIIDNNTNLYRVDITSTDTTLTFNPPVDIGTGWTSTLLAADGAGKLYGISGGYLIRYDVTSTKPTSNNDFPNGLTVSNGFIVDTLTTTAPGWLLTDRTTGELDAYPIAADGTWSRQILDPSHWYFANLVSPGGGLYYGRYSDGSMYHYKDTNPYDGGGADIQYYLTDPVDTAGWNQTLLSAQPNTIG